jgi:hypothetical protein
MDNHKKVCKYTKTSMDGFGTNWKTHCGHEIRYKAPMEVGFAPAPLPNDYEKFCGYCGGKIILEEMKGKES